MAKCPFPTGVPVQGDGMVGREKEVQMLYELLKDGQSVIIASPRRFGKTSLILEVLKRLKKEEIFTADLDLFSVSSKRELAEQIVDKVLLNKKGWIKGLLQKLKEGVSRALKHLELKSAVGEFEFILDFTDPKVDEGALLDNALEFPQIFAQKNRKHFVFSYDEFQDVLKLDGDILIKKMRATFQKHTEVAYIFAGSQESLMRNLFTDAKQAFYKFGRIFYLDVIEKECFKKYIIKTFHQNGISCSDEIADHILTTTGGHPYYTQLICQQIYYLIFGRQKAVEEKDLNEGMINSIIAERSGFDAMWAGLSEKKHGLYIIEKLALYGGSPYEDHYDRQVIYQALRSLEYKGIVKKIKKGEYDLRDPLFKEYVKMRKSGRII